jgi:GTP-binding protein EngB required for normal cell division
MGSSIYGKGDKGTVDREFSLIIRSIGYCENCFKTPPTVQLQCAHIISRRYSNTRADLRNAFSLCAGCHRRYTDHPLEFAKFCERTWAANYYEVMYVKSQKMSKVDWSEVKRHLSEVKKSLNAGTPLTELREAESSFYETS